MLFLLILLYLFSYGDAQKEKQIPSNPTSVEVLSSHDDELTQRLRKSLENVFQSSPDFALSHGRKPGTLIVTIPVRFEWWDKSFEISYAAEFSSIGKDILGISSTVSCMNDALTKCSTQILKDARIAVRFLNNPDLMQQIAIRASISEIKADPLKYDGKVVQLKGYAETVHGSGFVLVSEDHEDVIGLRSPYAVGSPIPVKKDELYEEFWHIRTDTGRDPPWVGIEVEIEGFVRVFKVNGKMAEEFSLSQSPVDVVPIRIIKIKKIEKSSAKDIQE